jgi:Na+-transporting NADH:ubiquinone oxidoreductase subunit NqrA
MANLIKLRKGLDINLKGKAATEVVAVKEPGFYALVPDDFTDVTPKVVVKEQEYVMAGGPLFIDKNHPEVKFASSPFKANSNSGASGLLSNEDTKIAFGAIVGSAITS